jgi:hypothetical protein
MTRFILVEASQEQMAVKSTASGSRTQARNARPLWICGKCARAFANQNQTHACGPLDLDHHFRGRPQAIRELFELLRRRVESIGPVIVLPEKTRIAFQVRMSFAQITPRNRWLDGHFVLARRRPHRLVRKIETMSPRSHVHHFRLESPADVDDAFMSFLKEAYAVGEQRHLHRPTRKPVSP